MNKFPLFNRNNKHKGTGETMKKISGVDNDFFFRGDFENKNFSNLDEVEVENLVEYIMRNWFHFYGR